MTTNNELIKEAAKDGDVRAQFFLDFYNYNEILQIFNTIHLITFRLREKETNGTCDMYFEGDTSKHLRRLHNCSNIFSDYQFDDVNNPVLELKNKIKLPNYYYIISPVLREYLPEIIQRLIDRADDVISDFYWYYLRGLSDLNKNYSDISDILDELNLDIVYIYLIQQLILRLNKIKDIFPDLEYVEYYTPPNKLLIRYYDFSYLIDTDKISEYLKNFYLYETTYTKER